MMRFSLYILFIIFLFPLTVQADVLMGRIISIDRERGEITLVSENCGQCRFPDVKDDGENSPEGGPPTPVSIIISTDHVPFFAKPHTFIRAWGKFSKEDGNHFLAHGIAGPGWKHNKQDSTGVRSRLRKRCIMNEMHHPPGPRPHDLPAQKLPAPVR